jgi:hypothetical protein
VSTLTATVDNNRALVRLDIDFSDVNAPYVTITRSNPTAGTTTTVRTNGITTSDGQQQLANGYGVVYDTEAPLDVPITYTATVNGEHQRRGAGVQPEPVL